MTAFQNPPQTSGISEFPKHRKWAVVGVSADKSKYGNKIYLDLRDGGYHVYGVNPKLESIEGDQCYTSLSELPEVPEVVNVVVPPAAGVSVVDECLKLGIQNIWFQPGAESDEAIAKAEAAGMTVVANACIMLQKHAWD